MQELRKVPWRYVKQGVYLCRKTFFSVDRPEQEVLAVEDDVLSLKRTLKAHYFTSGWKFSYHYQGEDANLRRPEPGPDPDRWYQLHIRIFEMGDGTCELQCHFELDPLIHPKLHLLEEVLKVEYALTLVQTLLVDAGYDVERVVATTSTSD